MKKTNIVKNLIDAVKKVDIRDNFPHINLGAFSISIQGSSRHYSFPKEDFYELSLYDSYEVAIFDENKCFVSPHKHVLLKKFEWVSVFEDVGNNPIAACVSRGKVELIMQDLLSLNSCCMN